MIIMGIDPGTKSCGYGVINAGKHIAHGVIRLRGTIEQRLMSLANSLRYQMLAYNPDVVAMEGGYIGQYSQAAMRLGEARGVVYASVATHSRPIQVLEYKPKQVKMSVAHGGAGKGTVQNMVAAILGLDETPPTDAADALAVAICHWHRCGAVV